MDDLFDDMPEVFADTFGEDIVFTPIATGIAATVQGIWSDKPVIDGMESRSTGRAIRLDLRLAELGDVDPVEGDKVTRVATGETGTVAPPIMPDGFGMVSVVIERVTV